MNSTQTISISKLRQSVAELIDMVVTNQEPMIILKRSKPQAVLVDIDYYQALEEAIFDLTDAREAEKAKKEPKDPLSSYIKKRWSMPA